MNILSPSPSLKGHIYRDIPGQSLAILDMCTPAALQTSSSGYLVHGSGCGDMSRYVTSSVAASAVVLSIYGSQQTVSCCGRVHSTEGLMRERVGERGRGRGRGGEWGRGRGRGRGRGGREGG